MVPARSGNCLERSGESWKTWGIVWVLTPLSKENDAEDGYFFVLWGTAVQDLGCGYIDVLLVQKLAVFLG